MAAPDDWTPVRPRAMIREDIRGAAIGTSHPGRLTTDLFDPHMSDERTPLLTVVREALAGREVEHTVDEGEDGAPASISFSLRGEHTAYDFLATVDEALDLVVCCARIPSRVPDTRRGAVCELLTRINYALRIGNFEMDLRDGELLFRTAIDVEGGTLTTAMVDSLVGTGFFTADRYFPAIMRVVYGGASPEEALAEPEGSA